MRLKESTLCTVWLCPRTDQTGALGGVQEAFSDVRIPLRASILPRDGEFSMQDRGAVHRERLRLLVCGDAGVQCGDGVWIRDRMWRICDVRRWFAHMELDCEAVV